MIATDFEVFFVYIYDLNWTHSIQYFFSNILINKFKNHFTSSVSIKALQCIILILIKFKIIDYYFWLNKYIYSFKGKLFITEIIFSYTENSKSLKIEQNF